MLINRIAYRIQGVDSKNAVFLLQATAITASAIALFPLRNLERVYVLCNTGFERQTD